MSFLEYAIIVVYSMAIVFIFFFAVSEVALMLNYLSYHRTYNKKNEIDSRFFEKEYPLVTIQLPVYNELYVMKPLLENIGKMDYPKDKLEIQVLDDSTDESYELTKEYVSQLQEQGFDIAHIHRTNRAGFKAGALKEGLALAKGDYIAIFDADFLPEPDWLLETLPYFTNDKIGAVQTKWGHINRDYSLLTKVQAFALDIHFTMEQVGRYAKGHFINFNGTAGIWRKDCILDAGNWKDDTLTEDLNLSYRAQLKQWKLVYTEDVETPAELPVAMNAAKSQQFRWNKGGAENFRRLITSVFQSHHHSLKTKVFGVFHLLSSSMFLFVFMVSILSIPILYIKNQHPELKVFFSVLSLFLVSTLMLFVSYWIVYQKSHKTGVNSFVNFVGIFLSFFTIALGFSLHNTIAVIEGFVGKQSEFVRTPKFNITSENKRWKQNKYLNKKISFSVLFEGLLALYFAFGMYSAFAVKEVNGDYGFLPFHLMLFIGFSFTFIKSISAKFS